MSGRVLRLRQRRASPAAQSAFRVSAGGLHAGDIRIPSGTYTDPASGASFALDRMPQTFDHSSEGGAGYSYQGEFGMVGIGGNRYEMNYGIPGVPPNADWMNVPPTTSRIAQQRNTVELRGLFNVGGRLCDRIKLDASYNDYGHSEFPTAQDSTGVSDPQANHFHKQEFNAVLQLRQRPVGRLSGTLGLWTDIQNLTIEGDQPLGPNSTTTGLAGVRVRGVSSPRRGRASRRGSGTTTTGFRPSPTRSPPTPSSRTLDASRLSNAMTASFGAIQQLTPADHGLVQRGPIVPRADGAGAVRQRPRRGERHLLGRHRDAGDRRTASGSTRRSRATSAA